METIIHNIINNIPSGCIFDSHTIIFKLIENHSNDYLQFVNQFNDINKNATPIVHGKIAQIIKQCNDLKQMKEKSFSKNIHNNYSECTCWRKI